MTTIGSYIAEKRRKLRLTQQDVADRLGSEGIQRKATTISSWENGNDPVPIELIPALARALEEPSPITMYELASVLENIPGNRIIKLFEDATPEELETVERIVRAYFKDH